MEFFIIFVAFHFVLGTIYLITHFLEYHILLLVGLFLMVHLSSGVCKKFKVEDFMQVAMLI